jgi:F0F1-type ATP synthase assembly protein I
MNSKRSNHAARLPIINAMLLMVVLIVMLQLWLLTASVNAYLGGDTSVTLPAALVSLACLGLNLGLVRYLYRLN